MYKALSNNSESGKSKISKPTGIGPISFEDEKLNIDHNETSKQHNRKKRGREEITDINHSPLNCLSLNQCHKKQKLNTNMSRSIQNTNDEYDHFHRNNPYNHYQSQSSIQIDENNNNQQHIGSNIHHSSLSTTNHPQLVTNGDFVMDLTAAVDGFIKTLGIKQNHPKIRALNNNLFKCMFHCYTTFSDIL